MVKLKNEDRNPAALDIPRTNLTGTSPFMTDALVIAGCPVKNTNSTSSQTWVIINKKTSRSLLQPQLESLFVRNTAFVCVRLVKHVFNSGRILYAATVQRVYVTTASILVYVLYKTLNILQYNYYESTRSTHTVNRYIIKYRIPLAFYL